MPRPSLLSRASELLLPIAETLVPRPRTLLRRNNTPLRLRESGRAGAIPCRQLLARCRSAPRSDGDHCDDTAADPDKRRHRAAGCCRLTPPTHWRSRNYCRRSPSCWRRSSERQRRPIFTDADFKFTIADLRKVDGGSAHIWLDDSNANSALEKLDADRSRTDAAARSLSLTGHRLPPFQRNRRSMGESCGRRQHVNGDLYELSGDRQKLIGAPERDSAKLLKSDGHP